VKKKDEIKIVQPARVYKQFIHSINKYLVERKNIQVTIDEMWYHKKQWRFPRKKERKNPRNHCPHP